jgi:predicted ATPase with chaperone activity
VHRLGVVGEKTAIKACYPAATSRLHRSGAISLLRRGAPASGKNYLIDAVIRLLPPESVVICSSTSDKALAYYGSGDPDALARACLRG